MSQTILILYPYCFGSFIKDFFACSFAFMICTQRVCRLHIAVFYLSHIIAIFKTLSPPRERNRTFSYSSMSSNACSFNLSSPLTCHPQLSPNSSDHCTHFLDPMTAEPPASLFIQNVLPQISKVYFTKSWVYYAVTKSLVTYVISNVWLSSQIVPTSFLYLIHTMYILFIV